MSPAALQKAQSVLDICPSPRRADLDNAYNVDDGVVGASALVSHHSALTRTAVRDGKLWSRPSRESPDLSHSPPDPSSPNPKTRLFSPLPLCELSSAHSRFASQKGIQRTPALQIALALYPNLEFGHEHQALHPKP